MQNNILTANRGIFTDRRAKMFFADAVSIDVGMVEVICAVLQGGVDKAVKLILLRVSLAHTAHNDRGSGQTAAAQ